MKNLTGRVKPEAGSFAGKDGPRTLCDMGSPVSGMRGHVAPVSNRCHTWLRLLRVAPTYIGRAAASSMVVLSLVGGCAAPNGMRGSDTLRPSADPYEADIPVPAGFHLVDRASEDWSSGSIRYLRHRYRGRADKYIVRKFYRRQMPLVRWTPISDHNVQGRIIMRFQRSAESCTITIEDRAAGFAFVRAAARRVVTVEAVIAPLEH